MEGFFGIGIQELILIAIVALIVLGPERLPATFREIAKFIRYVRNLTNEFTAQFGDDFKALEDLDPRRMLQREIESIDAEENKGKPATTQTATTKPATTAAKPKPATATTAKTTTTTTPKPATSTTAAKSSTTTSTTTAKPATTKAADTTTTTVAPAVETNVTTASTADAVSGEAISPESSAVTMPATESENRIAPPTLTTPTTEQSNTPVGAVAYNGSTNGVVKEIEAAAASNGTTNVAVATNGTPVPSTPQSE